MILRLTLLVFALSALAPFSTAAEPLPRTNFELDGRKAFIIAAPEPAKDRPWVWYAPTLPGLPGAGHQWYFERMLKAGISIAGIDLGEVRGSPASNVKFLAFHAEMVRRGFSAKPVLLGQSRGGLMMLSWAAQNPDKVTAFTGIYPVCNLTSWPMKNSKAAVLADYAMPEAELLANLSRFNPVENLKGLLEKRVPIFIVHGDSDVVVPLADNGEILKQRYEAGGGSITIKVIPGEGHKVSPSFFECQELVDFVIGRVTTQKPVPHANADGNAAPPKFETLCDGKTFTGWEHKGNWVIEDGAFFRKAKGGPLTYTVKPVPDDFELRFDWKVSKGCNSGVYYRPGQYEYQVLDNIGSPYGENPRQAAASLFFCMAPSKDATKPVGEWNEGRVMCKGTVIQHWLNGEKVIDFDYTDAKWAKEIELLRIRGADLSARGGKLWLQDHGADVWFRNIRLRTIPPEEKLERSEFTPMPVPPAALEKENARVQGMLKAQEKKK